MHDLATVVGELVVADRRRAEAEELASRAIELAGADALTGLGNRRTWRRAHDEEAARALVQATGVSLTDLASACLQLLADTEGAVTRELVDRYYG